MAAWLTGKLAEGSDFHRAVESEWRAQIRAVQNAVFPRRVDVLDGHRHVHMIPPLFRVAAGLAREAGIGEIRVTRERPYLARARDLLRPAYAINLLKVLLLGWFSRPALRVARRAALRFPDYVLGVMYSGEMDCVNVRNGIRAAEARGVGVLEVIVHVGRIDADEVRSGGAGTEGDFALDDYREIERKAVLELRSKR